MRAVENLTSRLIYYYCCYLKKKARVRGYIQVGELTEGLDVARLTDARLVSSVSALRALTLLLLLLLRL